jgi:hypothetical protein
MNMPLPVWNELKRYFFDGENALRRTGAVQDEKGTMRPRSPLDDVR